MRSASAKGIGSTASGAVVAGLVGADQRGGGVLAGHGVGGAEVTVAVQAHVSQGDDLGDVPGERGRSATSASSGALDWPGSNRVAWARTPANSGAGQGVGQAGAFSPALGRMPRKDRA